MGREPTIALECSNARMLECSNARMNGRNPVATTLLTPILHQSTRQECR